MRMGAIGADSNGKTNRTRRSWATRALEIQSAVKALFLSTAPLSSKCHLGVLQMRLKLLAF